MEKDEGKARLSQPGNYKKTKRHARIPEQGVSKRGQSLLKKRSGQREGKERKLKHVQKKPKKPEKGRSTRPVIGLR
jgi:hypothetical protein